MIRNTPTPAKVDSYTRWDGGIADSPKDIQDNEYSFGRSIDVRTDKNRIVLLPKTVKESGSVVTDLIVDGDEIGTDLYTYDMSGNIYKRDTNGSISLEHTAADSHGNGMKYYGEDDYLYYTTDTAIGRFGQVISSEIPGVLQTWTDDFLGAEGGIPQNTGSLDLEAGSSQYASRADTASLSITGDLALEAWIKPESLPTVGNSMVIASKWDVNTNLRSYKFEIYAISGYFGDGSDGALTISSNTTEAPIDSACTGTAASHSLSATNASFAAGQEILIHQTQGTGAGTWQRTKISSYTAGTITTEDALNATYTTGAQVRVLKQYTNVTINSGITYTAKAWNGTVGGILAFIASGTVTVTGTITASGKGFRGGAGTASNLGTFTTGYTGEGYTGLGTYSTTGTAPSNPGAGLGGGTPGGSDGGGGGGHASTGGSAVNGTVGGSSYDTSDLTTATLGGGGGGANDWEHAPLGGTGGTGGGMIFVTATTLTVSGGITVNGSVGSDTIHYGGGGGAGGSLLLKVQTATLGTNLISAAGGLGGNQSLYGKGGNGSVGRIHLDYYTSYTGTTTPTLNVTQDNTLVTTTTYQLRLALSSDGTAEEFLTKATTITTGSWYHVAVSWDASASTATFLQDGTSLGTATGAVTSLNNNASRFAVGCDFNSSARNFYDGLIDEVRIWNTERTATQINGNKATYISASSPGLVAWYQLNSDADDYQTSGNNDLTKTGSPVHSTDVPFSGATTRLDIDQTQAGTGQTYTTPTAISETAANRITFVPQKDPQKSFEINFGTKGTGTVQVTIHDALNRIIHQKEVDTTNLPSSGLYEFLFDTTWTPVRGATYHAHIVSSTGDATIVTGTTADLSTAYFTTYYQFLTQSDAGNDIHPIEHYINFLVIGNGHYVAKYSASAGYDPHRIELPPQWRVQCFEIWNGLLAIGCFRGDSASSSDKGHVFLWDGYSDTYIDEFPIYEGGINAMKNYKGQLYIFVGYRGEYVVYNGGRVTDDTQKKRLPKMTDDTYIETRPKAVAVWDGMLRWGAAGNSDNETVERGIYTFGRRKATSPLALTYDFPISTGSRTASTVEIGFVYPLGRKLLIGWRDNVSYGIDVVSLTVDVFAEGTIEQGYKYYDRLSKEKQALMVRADFEPLVSGQSVRVKYKLDDDTDWTVGDYEDTAGATKVRLPIDKGTCKQLIIATDLKTTIATSPALLEHGIEVDGKVTEGVY